MSPEDRAWLAGILEGLAGREVDPRLIDRIVAKCDSGHPANRVKASTPRGYDDYDGPGAPPLSEDEAVEQALPPQAKSIDEMKAQVAKAKALADSAPKPKRKKAPLDSETPVADKPPYNPENPTVVRMG